MTSESATIMTDASDSTASSPMNMVLIKLVLAAAIFGMGLVSVVLPQRLASKEGAQHWFSLGNMAASGILMCGGLVHMLADSAQVLNDQDKFPIANFVAGLVRVDA